MANYNGTHAYGIISTYSPTSEELTATLERTNYLWTANYTAGTGSYQCDSFFSNESTFSGLVTYDLDNLTDRYGTVLTLSKVKTLAILNEQGATGENLTISGDWFTTIYGASASLIVGPGGMLVMENPIDGWTVTAVTGDGISITTAGTYKHRLFVAGLD